MPKLISIPVFQYNPQEIARQFLIAIRRGGETDIIEHMRQIVLEIMSRADKPEVFQPILMLFTVMKDGRDINIEKMTQLATGLPVSVEKLTEENLPKNILPKGTQKYFRRLEKLGFLDKDWQLAKEPRATSRSEAMYIALHTCKALGMKKTQWKPFQIFWGIDKLAQEKWKWDNRLSKSPRRKDIDKAFEDY